MSFKAPPLVTPEPPRIRFLTSYHNPMQFEAWCGPVAAPKFIGHINRFGRRDWRSIAFPARKFKSRMEAAEFLL